MDIKIENGSIHVHHFSEEMHLIICIILLYQACINSSQYSFVQPDQLEYPGDEYVSLFAVFVSNNVTLHSKTNQLRYK